MGWFTHRQLNNLRDQISKVRNQQHWLLKIQQVTLTRLDKLETVLRKVVLEMESSETTWVNYFARDHGRLQLHLHIQKLTRALQAAHLWRLSVDLLNSGQLQHIFDAATRKAKSHHYQLMLCQLPTFSRLKHRTFIMVETRTSSCMSQWHLLTPSSGCSSCTPFCFPSPLLTSWCPTLLTKSSQFCQASITCPWKCLYPTWRAVTTSTRPTSVSNTALWGASSTPPVWAHCMCRTSLEPWCCAWWRSWSRPKLCCSCRTTGTWCSHPWCPPVISSAWTTPTPRSSSKQDPIAFS